MVRKCYAEKLGNCNGKITREHTISECVLNPDDNPDLKISMEINGEIYQSSVSNLTGKNLCKNHNGKLSELRIDEVGKMVLQFGAALSTGKEGIREIVGVDGNLLEKWLLKTLINGMWKADPNLDVPKYLLDIIFNDKSFDDNMGFYLLVPKERTTFFNGISFTAIKEKETNVGGLFNIFGHIIFLHISNVDKNPLELFEFLQNKNFDNHLKFNLNDYNGFLYHPKNLHDINNVQITSTEVIVQNIVDRATIEFTWD